MLRARPSWAAIATRRHAAGLSAASVATTAIVVFSGLFSGSTRTQLRESVDLLGRRWGQRELSIKSAIHGRPVARSTTSPAEFTTTTAPTVTPRRQYRRRRPDAALEYPGPRPHPGADRPDSRRRAVVAGGGSHGR